MIDADETVLTEGGGLHKLLRSNERGTAKSALHYISSIQGGVNMKLVVTIVASLISTAALAQSSTTVIEKRDVPSTTVIEERNEPTIVEKRQVETTGSVGCTTTTKQKTDEFGDTTTKRKTEC